MNDACGKNTGNPPIIHGAKSDRPLFRLGQVMATRAVIAHFDQHGVAPRCLLERHVRGDWGDIPPADALENEVALRHGFRVLSSYELCGERIWVITEADRSATTLLFPSEY